MDGIKRYYPDLIVSNDNQNLLKTISTAMASRDLHQGVKMGFLKRSGDKRSSVYQFKAIKE